MPDLIRIGNSRGVRIPKTLIQQAGLEGHKLEFAIHKDGLLIRTVRKRPRQDWEQRIKEALLAHNSEVTDTEWLNATLTDDIDWEW